jgi:hypothetical protein
MKSHLLTLCLFACALALGGCATTVAPLFPTSRATVTVRDGVDPSLPAPRSAASAELPVRSNVSNGMACRSE